jgi:hypothetical protein
METIAPLKESGEVPGLNLQWRVKPHCVKNIHQWSNWVVDHNKIGTKMNFKVPSHVKTTATSIWCTTEIEKNTKNKNKIK